MDFRLTPRFGYMCLFSLFLTVTDITAGNEMWINVNPTAVEFGDSLVVNCSITCAADNIIIEGIKDQNHGTQWRTAHSSSIQQWSLKVTCFAKCTKSPPQTKIITVYNREINITPPPEVLEVNRTYSLECTGPRVYPNNKLILTWLRGREILQSNSTGEEGSPDEDERLRNVFSFTASMSDDGQEYTCLAEVKLDSNTTEPIANSSVTLQTHYEPVGTFVSANNKTISESPVTFSYGDNIILICGSQGNPRPTLKWEYPKQSNIVNNPSGSLHISDATTKNNGIYKCTATNKLGADEKIVDVRVEDITAGNEMWINVNPTAVEFGDSLVVNCSTTCAADNIIIEGIKDQNHGAQWRTAHSSSIQQWSLKVTCFAKCTKSPPQTKIITVYNREISITPPPEMLEVNRTYSLECTGPRVYPNNKLILTWRRGEEIIQSNFTGEPGFPDEDVRLRNVFSFTASLSDDGQEYTCLAEVDLGSNTTKPIANSSVTLHIYSFMDPPRILDKNPIEVKQEVMLTCEVTNVYPAEKMRVRWSQDGEELNSVPTRPNSNTIRVTTAWTPQVSGLSEVTCTADFEEYPSVPPKNDSIFIEVYAFSAPEIQIPTSPEGNPVNITCSVFNVSGELQLRLKNGNDILVNGSSSSGLTIYHTVDAQAQLDGQQYVCEAEMKLQLQPMKGPIVKKEVETLHVLYAPLEAQIFKGQENWIKGKSQNLTCQGEGNPAPQVSWTKDEKIFSGEIFHIPSVQMQHGGLYKCTITNVYGSKNSSVNAVILYEPGNTTISVNNKTVSGFPINISKGDEITITCNSSGNPTPTVKWEDPSNGSNVEIRPPGVLRISQTTSGHQGIYKCRATNQYGIDEKEVDIRVKDEPGDTTISVNNKTVSGFPVYISKGDEVTITCNSSGIPTPTVKWEDPSNGSNIEIGPPGVLRISQATSEHQGIYKCRATNQHGIDEKEVDIRVKDKPRGITISVNNKTMSEFPVYISKGDEVTITCNSSGNPTPTVKWEDPSNGRNVEIGPPGVLRISQATSEHQGIYKCRVTNQYGIDEKEVDFRVKDKPTGTTISVNNKTMSGYLINVSKGNEVTITCNSSGNPTPTVKWEDPSIGRNVEIGPPGVLRISQATSEHQGIYKCRATNQHGIDEKEVDIRVKDQTSARRLAAKIIGLTSAAIVAGTLLSTVITCFRNIRK
ncbi:intercellular adhesion molecule 5-like isoform X2 [Cetorhinus maximus]